jgi:hypothetical protein
MINDIKLSHFRNDYNDYDNTFGYLLEILPCKVRRGEYLVIDDLIIRLSRERILGRKKIIMELGTL